MKLLLRFTVGLMLFLLAACQTPPPLTPTATLPPVIVITATKAPPTRAPVPPLTAEETAQAYLHAWQASDYAAMYALLTPASRAAQSLADFTQVYTKNLTIMTALGVTPTLTTLADNVAHSHVIYRTVLIGVIETEVAIPLQKTGETWGVTFSPALIWPDLVNGQQLYMVPFVPDRGIFYDRHGAPMVETTDAYAVGIVPNELTEGSKVVGGLARLFGLPASLLQAQIDAAPPDQYLPIGEVAEKELGARYRWLVGAEATRWTPFNARYYYGGGAAAHVTGYTIFIPPDQLAEYQAQGYAVDQRLGNAGLELWGEAVVRGTTGGQLTLLDAQGQPLKALIIKQPLYPPDVYTTLDFDLQKATQFALGDFTAAATVLNRDTGEVLALASSPTFDPNLFEPQNLNRQFSTGDASQGFLDRAAQDAYAAGSVFKIITFGAGLTSNLFTPQTQYTCNGYFDEIGPALILKDWQEGGHGVVTLQQGLSGSCNPYFWHVGLALHNFNPQWLPDTARAFGLGQTTGLTELQETPGIIPDPEWKRQTTGQAWETLDTLNMAIGQGDVLVTPLQMARLVAAVGNGGALLQPYLVQKVQAADATPSHTFTRTVVGQLPLDATQLAALQAAMHNVTQPPIGTARNRFRSLPSWLKVAGKTGTAEDPGVLGIQEPHAWFVGYTFANRPDKPDIAIAVWVGNRGQGSDYAAPIFRRILEAYYGLAYTRYPWEESVGVPAPEETPTPEAAPTAAP